MRLPNWMENAFRVRSRRQCANSLPEPGPEFVAVEVRASEDLLKVAFHCADREVEGFGDLAIGSSGCDEECALMLGRREPDLENGGGAALEERRPHRSR